MIVALCELGIELDDPSVCKERKHHAGQFDDLLPAGEAFLHTSPARVQPDGDGAGFYGLVAAQRAAEGRSSLYRMSDALSIPDAVETEMSGQGTGLGGKGSRP